MSTEMDNNKINALMIYYKHWGIDEIKMSRKLTGFIQTMNKIKSLFIVPDDDFAQDIDFLTEVVLMESWIHYGPASTMDFLNKMANVLLSNYGGVMGMYNYHHHTYEWKLAKSVGISVYHVYSIGMTDSEMRNVDAIVSL